MNEINVFEENDSSYQQYASNDPKRDPKSFFFRSKVESLGQQYLKFSEPSVQMEEAFFGMG